MPVNRRPADGQRDTSAALEFRILGPFEVVADGRQVPLGGRQQRALLAILVLNPNRPVSTDLLVDELWGPAPPATATKIVQNYVSRLRAALPEDVLETRGSGYALRLAPASTDVDRFEELLAAGRDGLARGEPAEAVAILREALALWRGPALADFTYEAFAQAEIARLEERRLVATEERVEADLQLGRHGDLVGELEALIREHPHRERLRAALMLALYRSGRQREALHAYGEARMALVSELGLEPGPALRQLEQRILKQDPSLDAPAAAPPQPGLGLASRRSRRRLAVATLVVLAAAAVAVAVLTASPGGLPPAPANAVVAVDPHSAEVVAEVQVGRTPTSISIGEGAVWVLNADDQTITRVDPRTRAAESFGTGALPTDLAAGAGSVWVGNGTRRSPLVGHPVATSVARLDPSFGQVRQTIRLPGQTGSLSNVIEDHIAVGGGAVWVVNPNFTLSRIDPRAGRVTAVSPVRATAVAADATSVWTLDADGAITRVEPRAGRATRRVKIAATALTDIAVGDGSVWVAAPFEGVVWRVDAGPRLVLRTIDAGFGVNRLAYGEGALWAVNGLRGSLTRIDPRTNAATATVELGNTPRDVATGDGRVWVAVAGAGTDRAAGSSGGGVRQLPRSICSPVFYSGPGTPDRLIVSDLPLQGGEAFPTLQMSQAIAFTLRRRGFRAGRYRVGYQSCDDATSASGIFDEHKCASNMKAYVANPDVLGVVGPFNSGCAFAQIPLANAAGDGALAIVSPSSSVVDLTRRGARSPKGLLAKLYPSGKRNYVRVSPTEDSGSAANALLAKRLGLRRIFVLDDGDELFGLPNAIYFRRAARRLGLHVVGSRSWDPRTTDLNRLAELVTRARPDGVFVSGGLYSFGGALVADLRSRLGNEVAILAPGFLPLSGLFEAAGDAARGTYVSLTGLTLDRLPAAGRRFLREFAPLQPGGKVETFAVYAAEAADVLLDAIARSDGTRASVVRELFAAPVRRGLVGDYRFTADGDTTDQAVTILRATAPGGAARIGGTEGGVVDRVLRPDPKLTR
jgi:DNA-binding SARP family transcriptional activator/ABC-type branched-subunit amino acid transport system substrate-binding protein